MLGLIEPQNKELSIRRQCNILKINRNTYYNEKKQEELRKLRKSKEIELKSKI